MIMTSSNGTNLVLTSPTSQSRRKRAIDNSFDFSIATTGGMYNGLTEMAEGEFIHLYTINRTQKFILSNHNKKHDTIIKTGN